MTPRLCWIIYQQKTSGRKFRVQLYPISILSNALHSRERERELDEIETRAMFKPAHARRGSFLCPGVLVVLADCCPRLFSEICSILMKRSNTFHKYVFNRLVSIRLILMSTTTTASSPKLAALGFCGADDSVNHRHLILLGKSYPTVEWGILFRPDKEGEPRYATIQWVRRLAQLLKQIDGAGVVMTTTTANTTPPPPIRLAAHLCGSHVNNLLSSSTDNTCANNIDTFLTELYNWGFRRVQVNATAVNGVHTENLGEESTIQSFLRTTAAHPKIEFICQKNEETFPLWNGLLQQEEEEEEEMPLPENIVFLHDESKGTGKETSAWSTDPQFVTSSRKIVGYAGGIKPANVGKAAQVTMKACQESGGKEFWIDMESGVRSKVIGTSSSGKDNEEDIFDLSKCYECIDTICELGLMQHPSGL